MKVILTRDVPNVGKQGDVATVAEGYARNYLFPRKLAIEASPGNLKNIERQHQIEERLKEQRRAAAEKAASELADRTVTIRARTGAGTRLYGSITAQDIAEAIKGATGVEVDRRKITMSKPIRTTGTFTVPVQLHRDVVVNVHLEVVPEE